MNANNQAEYPDSVLVVGRCRLLKPIKRKTSNYSSRKMHHKMYSNKIQPAFLVFIIRGSNNNNSNKSNNNKNNMMSTWKWQSLRPSQPAFPPALRSPHQCLQSVSLRRHWHRPRWQGCACPAALSQGAQGSWGRGAYSLYCSLKGLIKMKIPLLERSGSAGKHSAALFCQIKEEMLDVCSLVQHVDQSLPVNDKSASG